MKRILGNWCLGRWGQQTQAGPGSACPRVAAHESRLQATTQARPRAPVFPAGSCVRPGGSASDGVAGPAGHRTAHAAGGTGAPWRGTASALHLHYMPLHACGCAVLLKGRLVPAAPHCTWKACHPCRVFSSRWAACDSLLNDYPNLFPSAAGSGAFPPCHAGALLLPVLGAVGPRLAGLLGVLHNR